MTRIALLLLAAVPAVAADVTIKPVYLQPLDHTAVVDRRGNPWFLDADGVRGPDNKVVCPPLKRAELLLVDAAKRVWWRAYSDGLTYHDGTKWNDTKIYPTVIHEDAAGRVVVLAARSVTDGRTASSLHVFADGKWVEEKLPIRDTFDRIHIAPRFADDAKGRTWHWLENYYKWAAGEPAAWAFDGKKWTAHAVAGRKDGESIDQLLPFQDDWFLVLASRWEDKGDGNRRHRQRTFAWSPGRTADEIAKANPFPGLPLDSLEYTAVGADGVRYFRWLDRNNPDMPAWQVAQDKPPYLAVAADGKVTKLTREQGEKVAAGLLGERLPRPAVGTPDSPPVLPFPVSRVVGTDTDGRTYLESGNDGQPARRAWVLWPAKEKPGDVLRLTAYPRVKDHPVAYADLFADANGFAFARPFAETDHILAWDDKAAKWAGTPIKPLPHAHWTARPAAPPEYGWANFRRVGHVSGTDGRTVFARVKTRYAPEADGQGPRGGLRSGRPGGARSLTVEEEKKADDTPFYQYEAWTHRNGSWSEPHPPADLFKAKRQELIAGLAVPHTPTGPVPVISHGGRLWYAMDWKVYALDADGSVYTANVPKPESVKPNGEREVPTPPVMLGAFARLDDKTLVLAVAGAVTKTYTLRFRAVKLVGIQVAELARLPASFPILHKAPDGPVRAWADRRNEVRWDPHLPGGRSETPADPRAVYRLDDGRWYQEADIAPPLAVAPDGTLWCPPHTPNSSQHMRGKAVLVRARGKEAEKFIWDATEWEHGFERPSQDAAVFVLPGVGLIRLEPAKDGDKPTLRVRYLDPTAAGQPVRTAAGHALCPDRWGTLTERKGR